MEEVLILDGGEYAEMLQVAEAVEGAKQVVWNLDHFEVSVMAEVQPEQVAAE